MSIKKVVFKGLSSTLDRVALGGIRFYGEDGKIIESGNIIGTPSTVIAETEKFIVSATSSYNNTTYAPSNAIDTKKAQTSPNADGSYWLALNDDDNLTFSVEFKTEVNIISKIDFNPTPDANLTNRGVNQNFSIEFYSNSEKLIASYEVIPEFSTRNKINTINTPVPIINKILLSSNDNTYSLKKGNISNEIATPIMTSNTTPSGIVTSNSNIANQMWRVFDRGITSNSTTSNVNDYWISYEFEEEKEIIKYSVESSSTTQYRPKNWNILGSKDGINWKIIDTRADIVYTNNIAEFTISNSEKFKHYRLHITLNNGSNSSDIREWRMFELIRSEIFELPSYSEQNFIDYGVNSPIQVDEIFTNKKYILQDTVSENEEGLWTTQINRKPLSIKFN